MLPVTRTHSTLPLLLLVGAAILLFFSRLDCPLLEPEETRYAEIPRQMLAAGHWLVPVCHGQPYYDKPPLLYWLVMGSYTIFGVHDWAARLVPSAIGVLCVLATYWWGTLSAGRSAGLAGGFVLCLAARFVYLGRMLTMNGLLALCVMVALAAGQQALQGAALRRRWWLVSAAAVALGVLAKGPVAAVLVVPPLFAYQIWNRDGPRPRLGHWLAYGLTSVTLAAGWFIAVTVHDPSFLTYFFWTHHVVRYVAPLDHEQPFWYYLPGLLLGMLPWTLLLPGLAAYCWQRRCHWRRPGPEALYLLAFGWCLLFHSASGCKRSGYILPALPPLALALGWYLDRLCTGQAAPLGWSKLAEPRLWRRAGVATFALTWLAVLVLLPAYARRYSLREQALAFAEPSLPFQVVCYPHRWDSVNYYLQRGDVQAFSPGERERMLARLTGTATLAFVKSDRSLADFVQHLPESLEFVPCLRGKWVTVGWVRPRP